VAQQEQEPPRRRSASETREHVLGVTHDLFYWQGIRGTGVDGIAAAAGVAPTTLYRLFSGKDDLVAAYVERAARNYREWFTAAVDAAGTDPRGRILAVFDALEEQVQPHNCRGCPFLQALAELPDENDAAHRHAVAVKTWMRGQLRQLVDAFTAAASPSDPVADPVGLADHLALLMEGVYASVSALGAQGPARRARAIVESLLRRPAPAL
jgi:AcrR family transcriptional regulator